MSTNTATIDFRAVREAVLRVLPNVQLYRAKQTLEVALDVDIDLIDLAAANTVLRLEVVRDGKLLHQHGNEQALAFEARVLGDYAELMDATREIRESIRKRGTVYAV